MSIKTQSIGALFVALVIILAVNPKIVNNIYGTILGRLFLICIVIFFAINNTTLGLLVALAIITASNQFGSFVEASLPMVEGMENGTPTAPTTVGDDNANSQPDDGQTVLTASATEAAKKKISDLKQEKADGTMGIDKVDIEHNIMSKDSKQIPVDPNMNNSSTGEVNPSSEAMLNSSATLEGFSAYAPY